MSGMPIKEQPATDLDYRAAITGLRAIAVMGVLLYHLKFKTFQGGFAGVDIFFVISGYLITRQILESAAERKFSFLEFYARRMSRILPALIFTIVVSFLFGALWLSPEYFRALAKEANHALLTISNIQYWREVGEYFAPDADHLSLLHCWSLSLEEQFYLVWPVFILLSLRVCPPIVTIGLAAVCSFALAAIWAGKDPHAVFFLMPFRIFEFATGALVIFSEKRFTLSKTAADIVFCIGLLTIGFSILYLDSSWRYLGCAVLAPCLGAAAIIQSGKISRLSFLLTNKICIGIGLISYSLYLCHWPILFFARYIFGGDADSATGIAIIAAMTFATGAIMYRFVEQPFRYRHSQSDKRYGRVMRIYASMVAALLVVGFTAFLQNGWTWRLSRSQIEITDLQRIGLEPCARFGHRRCAFGELGSPVGLEIVGDSHAWHYVSGLDPIMKELHLRGETPTLGGCLYLSGIRLNNEWTEECQLLRNELFDRLRKTKTPVFLSQYWQMYDGLIVPENPALQSADSNFLALLQRGLEQTIRDIGSNGRRIMLIGAQVLNECNIDRARVLPGPLWHAPPPPCTGDTKAQAMAKGAGINDMLRAVQAKWPNQITLLLPVDYMCDETCIVVSDGNWLYRDKGHLSVAGSRYFGMRAHDALTNFLKSAAQDGG